MTGFLPNAPIIKFCSWFSEDNTEVITGDLILIQYNSGYIAGKSRENHGIIMRHGWNIFINVTNSEVNTWPRLRKLQIKLSVSILVLHYLSSGAVTAA